MKAYELRQIANIALENKKKKAREEYEVRINVLKEYLNAIESKMNEVAMLGRFKYEFVLPQKYLGEVHVIIKYFDNNGFKGSYKVEELCTNTIDYTNSEIVYVYTISVNWE